MIDDPNLTAFSFQAKAVTTPADGPDMRLCSKNQLLRQA